MQDLDLLGGNAVCKMPAEKYERRLLIQYFCDCYPAGWEEEATVLGPTYCPCCDRRCDPDTYVECGD